VQITVPIVTVGSVRASARDRDARDDPVMGELFLMVFDAFSIDLESYLT